MISRVKPESATRSGASSAFPRVSPGTGSDVGATVAVGAAHDHLEPHRVQSADPHGKAERMIDRDERDSPAGDGDVEPAREARRVHARIDPRLLRLERRDLREVEDVTDVQPVP